MTFPHCDPRVLHSRSAGCKFCDRHGDWQGLRDMWGIAFSGEPVDEKHPLPCPADYAVQMKQRGDYNKWYGNLPKPVEDLSRPVYQPGELIGGGEDGGTYYETHLSPEVDQERMARELMEMRKDIDDGT